MNQDKPSLDQKCGRCKHPFGEHYRRYDDKNGCANTRTTYNSCGAGGSDGWGGSTITCDCNGFLIVETKEYTYRE